MAMADNEEHDEIGQVIKQFYAVPAPDEEFLRSLAARTRQELGPTLQQQPRANDRLRQQMLEVFDPTQTETNLPVPKSRYLVNWRWIMRHPVSRVAAATIFVLAAGGVALWFSMGNTNAAFADFLESIITVKSAKFKSTLGAEGKPSETAQAMFLAPNRFRYELPGRVIICNGEKMLISDAKEKRAVLTEFANMPKDVSSQNWFADLQMHLLQARDDPKVKRETLGEKLIDGHKVVGYQLTMPDKVIILWGDPKAGLPIRIEQRFVAAEPEKFVAERESKSTSAITMTDFVLNLPLDESLFSLEPPAGYTVVRGEVDASSPREKDLIEALRCYSDLFGGAFPDSFVINDRTMNPIMERIFVKKGWKLTQGSKPSQEQHQVLLETLSKIGRGFEFAAENLASDSDAHYAGKGISFGTKDTPIFWYRPKDAKQYRVIYADLSVGETGTPPSEPNAQPAPVPSESKK
jgi:outer membrane lipoprotein-sorting protein